MIEILARSVTCLLVVIARSELAAKTVSMDIPLTYGTIEFGGGGTTAKAS